MQHLPSPENDDADLVPLLIEYGLLFGSKDGDEVLARHGLVLSEDLHELRVPENLPKLRAALTELERREDEAAEVYSQGFESLERRVRELVPLAPREKAAQVLAFGPTLLGYVDWGRVGVEEATALTSLVRERLVHGTPLSIFDLTRDSGIFDTDQLAKDLLEVEFAVRELLLPKLPEELRKIENLGKPLGEYQAGVTGETLFQAILAVDSLIGRASSRYRSEIKGEEIVFNPDLSLEIGGFKLKPEMVCGEVRAMNESYSLSAKDAQKIANWLYHALKACPVVFPELKVTHLRSDGAIVLERVEQDPRQCFERWAKD